MKTRILIWFFTLFALCRPSLAQVEITITDPVPTRLAASEFLPRSAATQETVSALKVFNDVLWKDLQFSAYFELPSKSFFPLQSLKLPQDVKFEDWQKPGLDAAFLAFGNIQIYDSALVAEAYLYDVKTHEQVIGKRYTIADSTLVRQVAHQFADEIVQRLGDNRGVAQTRLAFTSLRGQSKEVYVADYDGANERTITANGGINKFPNWSPDNTKLAFITKLPSLSRWELWLQDLAGGRIVIPAPSSYVSSPAISPDGTRLAFSSRKPSAVDSDIFVSAVDGSGQRNLTNHPGIDTSPAWSPTGRQISFISDRSGTPQVWMMDADGSNVRRLVSEGGHCDSPGWSQDGQFVVYSWQAPSQWKHDIYIVSVAGGRIFQLTSGRGSNENPSWSPDGRHIAFQSTRSGNKQIFVMNRDGKNIRQVTAYGINDSPAWSSFPASQ